MANRWIQAVMREYRKNKSAGLKAAIHRAKSKYKKKATKAKRKKR